MTFDWKDIAYGLFGAIVAFIHYLTRNTVSQLREENSSMKKHLHEELEKNEKTIIRIFQNQEEIKVSLAHIKGKLENAKCINGHEMDHCN